MFSRSLSFAVSLAALIFWTQAATAAADKAEVRVMILYSHSAKPYEDAMEGFKEYMSSQGVRAQFDIFPLDGDPARASGPLKKAASEKINLILALGNLAASAANEQMSEIPVVAGLILNAETIRKKDNITSVILEFPLSVQLQWMQQLIPECKDIGVIYNPAQNLQKIEAAKKIAQNMGLRINAQQVLSPSDIPQALDAISRKVDALWGITDDLVFTPQTAKQMLLFSFRNRVPLIGISGEWVKAGALYALERDYRDIGSQCGEKALRILQGISPASMAPAPPRKVLYLLNLRTAEEIRQEFKEPLIRGAQQVFK